MKAKSMKLRTLITLHALYKYTDENHRMNGVKLNKFLAPYGLQCHQPVLTDTVKRLREFGVDVKSKGEWDNQGVWIEDRPLSNDVLDKLVFAVCTNPLLSDGQADEILSNIKPLVTVYQEPMLKRSVSAGEAAGISPRLYHIYSVTHKAIQEKRRVQYTLEDVRYDEERQGVYVEPRWERLYTPKYLCRRGEDIYMFGYDHARRQVAAVNLKDVVEARPAFKHAGDIVERALEHMKDIDPLDYIPGEVHKPIYCGPAEFRCRGQYVGELYRRFGPPEGAVEKDSRCRTVYRVSKAVIEPETLLWLEGIPGHGIRLCGPPGLVEAVRRHYRDASDTLTSSKLPACPPKELDS